MTAFSNKRRFFVALEGLRGLAACMVLVFHTTWTHSLRDVSFIDNAWMFVDLFFVLSGFVIANRYMGQLQEPQSQKAYALARFFRIYPLHIFYLALFLILHAVVLKLSATGMVSGQLTATNQPFWTQLFAHLTLLHSTGLTPHNAFNLPSWSISAEAVAYVFFFVVSVLGLATKLRPLFWLSLAVFFCAILMHLSKESALDSTSQYGAIRALFGFSLGVAIHAFNENASTARFATAYPKAMLGLQLLGFVLMLWILHVGVAGDPVTYLAPYIFALFIFSLAAHEKGPFHQFLTSGPCRFLGRVSYGVYMIHLLVIIVLKNLVDILGLVQGEQGLYDIVNPMVGNVMILVTLIASLIGAWLVNIWLEQPMIKLGKKIAAKGEVAGNPAA